MQRKIAVLTVCLSLTAPAVWADASTPAKGILEQTYKNTVQAGKNAGEKAIRQEAEQRLAPAREKLDQAKQAKDALQQDRQQLQDAVKQQKNAVKQQKKQMKDALDLLKGGR
ncbi:hypothetical protein [Methylogaea oryzae]|uniref:DUF4398 domain-containing protein n=1 Tax=Methylogaea oryzae TaxID=1295382 RepID=A0A8D4VRE0_9GAMM|nr:hypothetical protein [Methylogaea oryzae]BBL72441.1 hypothetical protein MoryE10_30470 [Methylogaea oryzae]